jgi:hypothetical protein
MSFRPRWLSAQQAGNHQEEPARCLDGYSRRLFAGVAGAYPTLIRASDREQKTYV